MSNSISSRESALKAGNPKISKDVFTAVSSRHASSWHLAASCGGSICSENVQGTSKIQRALKARVRTITSWRQTHATGGIKCVTDVPMDRCVRRPNDRNLLSRSGGKTRFVMGSMNICSSKEPMTRLNSPNTSPQVQVCNISEGAKLRHAARLKLSIVRPRKGGVCLDDTRRDSWIATSESIDGVQQSIVSMWMLTEHLSGGSACRQGRIYLFEYVEINIAEDQRIRTWQ
jgi:hypothetical protein